MQFNNFPQSKSINSRKMPAREAFIFPTSKHDDTNCYHKSDIPKFRRSIEPERRPLTITLDRGIRDDIWNIKKSLELEGYNLYIIGGAVRDYVHLNSDRFNRPLQSNMNNAFNNAQLGKFCPKDFDLVTDAKPEEINSVFKKSGYISNILNFGESFAIKVLQTKRGNTFELATLRKDIGGGRRPDSISFQSDLFEDAKRRDLTINSLYYEIKGKSANGFTGDVIDYFGGIEDIKNKIISPVGGRLEKFAEDPLRKIRALRFAARLNYRIPSAVARAIMANETSIVDGSGKKITNERLRDEFYKGINSPECSKNFLELLNDYGFYKHIFKNLKINKHSFVNESNPIVIVAGLLKNNEVKQIENELLKQNFSRSEITSITFLVRLLDLNENNVSELKRIFIQNVICDIPKINGVKCVITPQAMRRYAHINNINKKRVENFIRLINELPHPSIIVSQMGILPSKDMGKMIRKLEMKFFIDPQKILDILDRKDIQSLKKLLNI